MASRLESGTPMCAFGADLRIVVWNEAAERLTGVPSRDAVGRPCWAVLGGRADDGSLVCHKGCSGARLACEGWPVSRQALTVKTSEGRRRVTVETVSVFDGPEPLILHLLRPAPEREPSLSVTQRPPASLTPRQLDVLRLLAKGTRAQGIARELGLTETTVRNHIHSVLVELHAHSQLQAVVNARSQGFLLVDP